MISRHLSCTPSCHQLEATIGSVEFSDAKILENLKFFVRAQDSLIPSFVRSRPC